MCVIGALVKVREGKSVTLSIASVHCPAGKRFLGFSEAIVIEKVCYANECVLVTFYVKSGRNLLNANVTIMFGTLRHTQPWFRRINTTLDICLIEQAQNSQP